MPVCVVPATLLLLWLYYHGVPQPKGSSKKDLVYQVQRALDLKQPLEEDRIVDATTAKSYVSFDSIVVLSEVEWNVDGDVILITLKNNDVPTINSFYIDAIFGEGKNGIRERAWLRFESGHLNVETKLSKCDCPNGWLFCSHSLACFLLFYLIQVKEEWTFSDVVQFMPAPIKSLQSVPFATSFVFGVLKVSKPGTRCGKKKKDDEYTRKMAKSIASNVPGYSGKYSINDADAVEESRILDEELGSADNSKDVKNVDLCGRIDRKVVLSTSNESSNSKENEAKVNIADVTSYNHNLVTKQESNQSILRRLHRHERLHLMMKDGAISKNKTLWFYLDHFAEDRKQNIEQLSEDIPQKSMLSSGPKSCHYNNEELEKYFAD